MQVAGASLSAAAAECSRVPPWRLGRPDLFSMCLAPVQGHRALFGVSAAGLVVLGAMAVLFLAPVVIERRRRLRLAGPSLAPAVQRMRELAREAGLRRPPNLFARRVQLEKRASAIDADPSLTPAGRVARYRREILVPLRALLTDAELYVPPDDRVAKVHQHCVAALRLAVAANEDLALAWQLNNQVLRTRGQASLHTELTQWQTWASEVSRL
jgi:hypothetical protein